ncbi:MAG: NUDIX hydrolase [Prevotella sp.]|nr:NUDIX hydrolase [Prevotella sp.]
MLTPDKDLHWKVIRSEYLFNEPWLTVRRDSVELKNGRQIPSYYVLEYPEWVNIIAITREKQFVFIRQYRHGIQSVNYELCAGVCEQEDASPLVSAQRELLEETGYGNGDWEEYMNISANTSTMSNVCHCFLARNVEKISEQQLDDTEELSVHLLSLDDVKNLLKNDEIRQSLMAAPLWKYIATNG